MPDESLNRATAAVIDLAASVKAFTKEVERDQSLRAEKVRAIQRVLYVLAPAVAMLVLLAITNFVLLSRVRKAAVDARATNVLLASCFQPNSACARANKQQTDSTLDKIRQTQFVIAVCQRQNPIEKDPKATRVVSCVQRYYPNFTLPPQAP